MRLMGILWTVLIMVCFSASLPEGLISSIAQRSKNASLQRKTRMRLNCESRQWAKLERVELKTLLALLPSPGQLVYDIGHPPLFSQPAMI